MASRETLCEFNMETYQPPQYAIDSFARMILPSMFAAWLRLLHARQVLDRCVLQIFSKCGAAARPGFGGYIDRPGGTRNRHVLCVRQGVCFGALAAILFTRLPAGGQPQKKQSESAENTSENRVIVVTIRAKKSRCLCGFQRTFNGGHDISYYRAHRIV